MPRDVPPSCGTQERALNWESEDHDLNLVSATSSCVHWGCGLPRGMGRSPQFLFFKNYKNIFLFSSVTQSCPTFCDPMDCRTPGLPVHHQLPEFTQTHVHESVMPSNQLILCHPLLLPLSIIPSIRVFSNESALSIRWPKYWSFSFSLSLQWIFRTDFLQDGLVGSPCSPKDSQESSLTPQFKSINSLVLSFLYNPTFTSIHDTGRTITLTRRTFVGKVMSPLFYILSRLVITFLPRSKHLLISWLQSPSSLIK